MKLTQFVDRNIGQIEKYKKFLEDNNWALTEKELNSLFIKNKKRNSKNEKQVDRNILKDIERKEESFKLQSSVVKGILDRLKYFINTYEGDRAKVTYEKFLNICKDAIEVHLERSEDYIDRSDLTVYKDTYLQDAEVKLQNIIFSATSSLRENMSGMNLSTGEDVANIQFIKDQYAPLVMHETIISLYPSVKKKLDEEGIDFESLPEPKMHIHNDNPPEWESRKHYFDQDKNTLQYYVDELKKIKNGIYIDGLYISGWMYYHINFFVTTYPSKQKNPLTGQVESKDITGVPPLRDNEWWIIQDNYEKAKKEGKMLFVAATRRAAKTTMNTSHLGWCLVAGKSRLLVAGGASEDLGQVQDSFTLLQNNIHPAFKVYNLIDDWSQFVKLGVKQKTGKNLLTCTIKVVNLDGGTEKKSEILAGFTPDAVIIDEIMKLPFKNQLAALKPAIDSPEGKRCVVILTGTAGNEDLAKDAFDVLREPTKNGVLNMPWDILNSRVPSEVITWKERNFGTFIPAQMSAKTGMVKDDSNLADFLKIESDALALIPIKVTNWANSLQLIKKDRDALKDDILEYTKEVLYYPLCPSDMLLSGKVNPFPVQEAIMHREYLKTIGGKGKKVTLTENTRGDIKYELNDSELASYPFQGGFKDCPIVLYEELPSELPPDNLYVAGFDDYKQEESGTDSIGSFHIFKVDYSNEDEFSGKIVASLASRPDPHGKLHHQILLLQKAFNAKCFMENADLDYETYLKLLRIDDYWLQEAMDFEGDMTRPSTGRRKYGWNPSNKKNRDRMFSLLVSYTKRRFEVKNDYGDIITILGIQKIDDIALLDEIINYTEGKNVDRITSFMSCLGFEFYLYVNKMFPDPTRQIEARRKRVSEQLKTAKRNSSGFFQKNLKRKYF